MVPLCVVLLGQNEIGDELGTHRKEDEAIAVETAMNIST